MATTRYVRYICGQVLLEEGDAAAAAEMLATAVASAPSDPLALSTLATALQRMKRLEEATLVAAAVTEADPTSAVAFNNLGLLLAEAERHEDAISAFAAGIRLEWAPQASNQSSGYVTVSIDM